MKDCLILGPPTALLTNYLFPFLKSKIIKIGVWTVNNWVGMDKGPQSIYWYTTLHVNRPEEKKLILTKTYNENDYQKYDNYDAIEAKIKDIPIDYTGKIGVPTSYFPFYPYINEYEILEYNKGLKLHGQNWHPRLIIRRKTL